MQSMIEYGNNLGLMSFEQVRDIYLVSDPFTIANGLLTPTSKMKRQAIKNVYQATYDSLYIKLQ